MNNDVAGCPPCLNRAITVASPRFRASFSMCALPLLMGLGVLALGGLAGASEPPVSLQAEGDVLADMVAMALTQNPRVAALEAGIEALKHKVVRAGGWRDPKLVIAYQNVPIDSFAQGQEAMSMVSVRLEQSVPWFGRTEARRQAAEHAVRTQRWKVAEKRNQLRASVIRTYYQLTLARQLEALTRVHVGLVDGLIQAVRVKYELGRAGQQNLLRLEVLRERLRDSVEDFVRQDTELTAALNAAMHRDVTTVITTPAELELPVPDSSLTVATLKKVAIEHRPALRALASTGRMHRANAEVNNSELFADPTLFAAYGARAALESGMGGRDLVTFGIGIPLPVNHASGRGAQALAAAAAGQGADDAYDGALDEIAAGISGALASWRRASGKVATYVGKVVPGAQSTLDATISSYQLDRADFLSLYEAEVDLLTFEKAIRMAAVKGLSARTTLEMYIGKELP